MFPSSRKSPAVEKGCVTFSAVFKANVFPVASDVSPSSLTGSLQHVDPPLSCSHHVCSKWLISPAHFSCYCPRVLCSSRAGLWPSELLLVISAFEGNGRRSMWWMAFMKAQYRWHDGSKLSLWEGEHQPEYITASPSPLLHLLLSITLSFLRCGDWSLTQTLSAL